MFYLTLFSHLKAYLRERHHLQKNTLSLLAYQNATGQDDLYPSILRIAG
jgi:hypothetical protein